MITIVTSTHSVTLPDILPKNSIPRSGPPMCVESPHKALSNARVLPRGSDTSCGNSRSFDAVTRDLRDAIREYLSLLSLKDKVLIFAIHANAF